MRLNIGCGDRHWEGFVNVDMFDCNGVEPDLRADSCNLPIPDNSVDEVHAIHTLEHVKRNEAQKYVEEWVRVLKPGGLLVIECPDLNKIALQLFNCLDAEQPEKFVLFDGREVDIVQDCKDGLYGDRKSSHSGMVHHWCYQQVELIDIMLDSGCLTVSSCQPKFHRPFRDMRLEGVKR